MLTFQIERVGVGLKLIACKIKIPDLHTNPGLILKYEKSIVL